MAVINGKSVVPFGTAWVRVSVAGTVTAIWGKVLRGSPPVIVRYQTAAPLAADVTGFEYIAGETFSREPMPAGVTEVWLKSAAAKINAHVYLQTTGT